MWGGGGVGVRGEETKNSLVLHSVLKLLQKTGQEKL